MGYINQRGTGVNSRPVLFNVFINDIFHFAQDSTIYNYADDNTLSYSDTNINTVIKTLENDSINLIDWFSKNLMKIKPDKFQAIVIGPKTNKHNWSGNRITCKENVKHLGVTVDSQLNFDKHTFVYQKCVKKSSQQLNILKRIHLNKVLQKFSTAQPSSSVAKHNITIDWSESKSCKASSSALFKLILYFCLTPEMISFLTNFKYKSSHSLLPVGGVQFDFFFFIKLYLYRL